MIKNLIVYNLYPKYGPKITKPEQYIAFELENTNMAIANSIRRVCEAELPTKRLQFIKFETNDAFMIQEFFQILLRTLPIDQTVPADKTFILEKTINTPEDQIITTDDIRGIKDYANPGHPIAKLGGTNRNRPILTKPNGTVFIRCTLNIVETTGYIDGRHIQCCAGSAVIQPVDKKPKAFGGEQSTMTSPTHYYIKMHSRGGYQPKKLFVDAISNIKTRLRNAEESAKDAVRDRDNEAIYIIYLPKETATIAELLLTEVLDVDPDCELFTYDEEHERVTFRSKDPEVSKLVSTAVNSLIAKYNKLETAFVEAFAKSPAEDIFGAKDLKAKLDVKFGHLPVRNLKEGGHIDL